jgi:cytochrome c553
VDKSELDYPFMPPFVGTEEEMAALAAHIAELPAAEAASTGGGGE